YYSAANIILSAHFYENRSAFLDNFPHFFHSTTLPILKERLASFSVTPEHIIQTLRNDPSLNPLYAAWFLSGTIPVFSTTNNIPHFSPELLNFTNAIMGQHPSVLSYGPQEEGPIDNRALRAMIDADGLPSRDLLFKGFDGAQKAYG